MKKQSVDFTWFLAYWLIDTKQDEKSFWDNMNPSRICRLMNAYYKPKLKTPGYSRAEKEEKSLLSYLMGGDGHGSKR